MASNAIVPSGEAASLTEAPEMVSRPRLLRRLQGHPERLVLLCAPSGYGKSTLLRQWEASDPRPFATVLLGAEHNDPTLLATSILLAVGERSELPPDVAMSIATPKSDVTEVLVPQVLAEFRERGAFVLVLDELEHFESPDSLALLASLCTEMPAGSSLALASRTEPAIKLGRLRANRRLIELRREDLTMTKSECAELLGGLGLDLAPRQLDAVVRRTEGWAAALYLAGLAIGDAPDQTRALSRFAGDDRVVVDYIREEFLESVSNRRLTFLRRASVLDRLSGPLCDAVLQQKGSASILRGLSRENMLLIPLDRRDEWFRFHPLLQRMLQAELRDAEPEVEGRLHLRASAWWREQAEWDRAIHHAIEGDATDVAGELLWSIIPEYMTRGRNASITGWLAVLGEERVGDSAAACLTAAWSALTLGNGPQGEHWAARAKTLMEDGATPGDVQSLKAGLLLVDAVMMKGGIKDMRSACSAALELLADDDPWVTICWMLDGIGMHLLGHRDHARKSLLEGIRHGMVVAPNLAVVCMSQLALLAIEEEDWRLADREVSQAHSLVESCGLREYPMVALGFAASAWVRAKSGRVDEASADLAAGRKLLSELESFAPWFEVETRIALAHAAIRLGNRQVARELLADAGTEISHMEDATVLVRWLDEAKAEIGNSEVELDEELTRAELRVLRQLRTHLSLPKIANELHVSPNTVKAQVRSIYSKLGVGSRQAAIERASQAGLLDLDG